MMEELINNDGSQVNENLIVEGNLTQEEMAYKKYDIEKLFGPTPYYKLLKRIPSVFKLCDASLGTNYFEELQGLAEREKAEWEAKRAETEAAQAEAENAAIRENLNMTEAEMNEVASTDTMPDPMAAPATTASFDTMETANVEAPKTRRSAATGLTADKIALLKGYDMLPEASKNRIKDVTNINGKVNIVWDTEADCLACDTCGAMSPEEGTTHCPVCGVKFE